jgi:hypothetical protein
MKRRLTLIADPVNLREEILDREDELNDRIFLAELEDDKGSRF